MSSSLTRRRLLARAGAAGAGAVWLGALGKGPLADIAGATVFDQDALRRSSYLQLSSPAFTALAEGTSHHLELIAVEDLPIAASVPALRDRDDAFSLRFRGEGRAAFAQGTHELRHPELGSFSLFLAPIEQLSETQDYEAVVDRTIPVPSLGDDGAPEPVEPGDRGQPAGRGIGSGRPAARLRHASLRRSSSGRTLVADLAITGGDAAEQIQATLLRRGRPVGRATARARRGRALLRFPTRAPRRDAAYVLQVVVVGADGQVTTARRRLRVG